MSAKITMHKTNIYQRIPNQRLLHFLNSKKNLSQNFEKFLKNITSEGFVLIK